MTILEKLKQDMDAAEGTYLENFLYAHYDTARDHSKDSKEYIKRFVKDWFGIDTLKYVNMCLPKNHSERSFLQKEVPVFLNAFYKGYITCATDALHRILVNELKTARKDPDGSVVINALLQKIELIIEASKYTDEYDEHAQSKYIHAIASEIFDELDMKWVTGDMELAIEERLTLDTRLSLVGYLIGALYCNVEGCKAKCMPQPPPQEEPDTQNVPICSIHEEPEQPPSTERVEAKPAALLRKEPPRLLDMDPIARKFLRDSNNAYQVDALTDMLDRSVTLTWNVFEGITEEQTGKKWSIFSDQYQGNYIAFFDAIHYFYKNQLIRKDELGTQLGVVKINTFIAMLRANCSCFRATDIHYLTDRTESIDHICLGILNCLILKGLYSTPKDPELPLYTVKYINFLYTLISVNYRMLVDTHHNEPPSTQETDGTCSTSGAEMPIGPVTST